MELRLTDKTALVTGATGEIGAAKLADWPRRAPPYFSATTQTRQVPRHWRPPSRPPAEPRDRC